MNPKIIQTENNIALYEALLMLLGENLAHHTDNRNKVGIKYTNENIAFTQQRLKEEMELLDLLTDKHNV